MYIQKPDWRLPIGQLPELKLRVPIERIGIGEIAELQPFLGIEARQLNSLNSNGAPVLEFGSN
jgi:hypothetical protein